VALSAEPDQPAAGGTTLLADVRAVFAKRKARRMFTADRRPTLLLDEADTFMRENEEQRGLLNAGHTREHAFVVRVVGDEHRPKRFSVWGAKALAGIGSLPDTIMDRAIPLRLRRKMVYERSEALRHDDKAGFKRLARQFARWAADNAQAVAHARLDPLAGLNSRAQDNWEPLLAIADAAGGDWPMRARRAAWAAS
jgi:putative DNA primase/helicase